LAERRGVALIDARVRLLEGDLRAPAEPQHDFEPEGEEPAPRTEALELEHDGHDDEPGAEIPEPQPIDLSAEAQALPSVEEQEARELEMSYEELAAAPTAPVASPEASDADVLMVLE